MLAEHDRLGVEVMPVMLSVGPLAPDDSVKSRSVVLAFEQMVVSAGGVTVTVGGTH
jgi:hypothetical protein